MWCFDIKKQKIRLKYLIMGIYKDRLKIESNPLLFVSAGPLLRLLLISRYIVLSQTGE